MVIVRGGRREPFGQLLLLAPFLRARMRLSRDIPGNTKTAAADGELIVPFESSFHDAHAVNANPVRAAEIADHEVVIDVGNAAMMSGNFSGIDLNIALGVAAYQHDRLVQQNAGTIVQRDELCRHGTAHFPAAMV